MAVFGSTNHRVYRLEDRLTKVEEYLEKKDKKFKESLTLNQKLLLLVELGIIDNLLKVNDNKKMVAKLLALVLEVSEQNLREELSHYRIREGSNLYTEHNITVIAELLDKTKFFETAEKVKNQLNKKGLGKL